LRKAKEKEDVMPKYPRNYLMLQKKFSDLMKAHEEVGKLAREAGPIDAKTETSYNWLLLSPCVPKGACTPTQRGPFRRGRQKMKFITPLPFL